MGSVQRTHGNTSPLTISADSIVGLGTGMALAQAAQNLPESVNYKSWILSLVPVVTLLVKQCWKLIEPEVIYYIKHFKSNAARNRYINDLNCLIDDPTIEDDLKKEFGQMKLHAKVTSVINLYRHWKTLRPENRDDES